MVAESTNSDVDAVLSKSFLRNHPTESARVLEGLDSTEAAAMLADIDVESAAAVLRRMASVPAAACCGQLSEDLAATLVARLGPDSAAVLLRTLGAPASTAILDKLRPDLAVPIRRLLAYPEGTVGAMMDPNVFTVSNDISVKTANERLARNADAAIYYVYVVDREQRLVGVLTMRELMRAEGERSIASVMKRSLVSIEATSSRYEMVTHAGWRRFHAIPVVDAGGLLLGVLRYETLRELETTLNSNDSQQKGRTDLALSLSELYVKGLTGLITGFPPRSLTHRGGKGSGDEEDRS